MENIEAIFETPGVGGALACTIIVALVLCYGLTIRWIAKGHEDQPEEE